VLWNGIHLTSIFLSGIFQREEMITRSVVQTNHIFMQIRDGGTGYRDVIEGRGGNRVTNPRVREEHQTYRSPSPHFCSLIIDTIQAVSAKPLPKAIW
jgi:hypothetical protein